MYHALGCSGGAEIIKTIIEKNSVYMEKHISSLLCFKRGVCRMYTNKGPATQLEVCVQKHLEK